MSQTMGERANTNEMRCIYSPTGLHEKQKPQFPCHGNAIYISGGQILAAFIVHCTYASHEGLLR